MGMILCKNGEELLRSWVWYRVETSQRLPIGYRRVCKSGLCRTGTDVVAEVFVVGFRLSEESIDHVRYPSESGFLPVEATVDGVVEGGECGKYLVLMVDEARVEIGVPVEVLKAYGDCGLLHFRGKVVAEVSCLLVHVGDNFGVGFLNAVYVGFVSIEQVVVYFGVSFRKSINQFEESSVRLEYGQFADRIA